MVVGYPLLNYEDFRMIKFSFDFGLINTHTVMVSVLIYLFPPFCCLFFFICLNLVCRYLYYLVYLLLFWLICYSCLFVFPSFADCLFYLSYVSLNTSLLLSLFVTLVYLFSPFCCCFFLFVLLFLWISLLLSFICYSCYLFITLVYLFPPFAAVFFICLTFSRDIFVT